MPASAHSQTGFVEMAATASPQSSGSQSPQTQRRELELQRKRARDRKSQQAMRDRTKWTIHTLGEQVAVLSTALDQRTRQLASAESKLAFVETENTQLRTQNAALQLSLMGRNGEGGDVDGALPSSVVSSAAHLAAGSGPGGFGSLPTPVWELCPRNTPPTCLADHIFQSFVDGSRTGGALTPSSSNEGRSRSISVGAGKANLRPSLSCLIDQKSHSDDDDIHAVVADVLKTYREIEGLPEQVAIFSSISMLLKWMVLLDQQSWGLLPNWLRPTHNQIRTPHAAWIDRVPWPQAREYLIKHPEITLDDWAAVYSAGLKVNWPYDPSTVLLGASVNALGTSGITINPVFEEHLRQLRHWTVGDGFRRRFPELARIIDLDCGPLPATIECPPIQQMSPTSSISLPHPSPK
ncbi:unnamed protein product [Clonostachys rhizophaga]|uniref:BZIP domain-containing protein n=1 Tax=Clonostachys rhizophaga TaxID=160324 RepID=A0A9N9YNT4_9HYPO|nr:unnamed protein product [Clonostachys rhizophaga]